MSSAYNISLTNGYFTTQLVWRIENNQFEIIDPIGVNQTIYVPFTSSLTSNQQFQATLDGVQYIVILTWNLFDERYYINIYNTSQILILSVPMVGSPNATLEAIPNPVVLTAAAGNSAINFTWTNSNLATSFNLYWALTAGQGENGTQIVNITGNSYSLAGLTNGETYYAVVTAVNSSGESAISNQASATPTNVVTWVNNSLGPVQWQNNSSQNVTWVTG
jgi:hypothetical protein